ncbi:hypothetical protein PFTANZ_06228, partial [Plasmodium falciparum Tanzania (2000708)]
MKTILRTPKSKPTKSHRSLCECDLYTSIYDNDPEIKKVMEDYDRQASQRFHEYEECMKDKRQKCKEQCEKDIQKIILKDKIKKELTEKLAVLQTDITTDDIPTCICEKSVADKVENICLNCGYGLGSALTSWEILGYTGIYGWKIFATALAKKIGIKEGMKVTIKGLIDKLYLGNLPKSQLSKLVTETTYANETLLAPAIKNLSSTICGDYVNEPGGFFCLYASQREAMFSKFITTNTKDVVQAAITKTTDITNTKIALVDTTTFNFSNVMIASGVTILVIALVMVIIYLILRY